MKNWILVALITTIAGGFFLVADNAAANTAPNGSIAFSSNRDGGFELFWMQPDGSSQTKVPTGFGFNRDPSWSPDGTQIVFATGQDIYVVNVDGTGVTKLINDVATDGEPVWSPDGNQIAFSSLRQTGQWEVWVMDADGNNPTNLTNRVGFDAQPAWSPDGTKIAFSSFRDGDADIYIMDRDGSNVTRVTTRVGLDRNPVWSPNGDQIAFESILNGNYEIFVTNLDGSGLANLTNHASHDRDPSWSPDGTRIAFTSNRDGDFDVYMMDTDGAQVTRLTDSPGDDIEPSWSSVRQPTPVSIDILPGSDPNCVNNNGHGVIPVAILSDLHFDATQVDPSTVVMDGQAVQVVGRGNPLAHIEDVNRDSLDDMVVQIEDVDGTYEEGDTVATVSGATYDGFPFIGQDSLCIVSGQRR